MAESATVIPIKPRATRKARAFTFPKDIQAVVAEHQWRACEAIAVAKLLAGNLREPATDDEFETNRFAADAIVRLLTPIQGLDDARHLVMQAIATEKANG